MQTPSERTGDETDRLKAELQTRSAPRSVFGNFKFETRPVQPSGIVSTACDPGSPAGLQNSIDHALARSFLHRFLAKAYEYPTQAGWHWLCDAQTHAALESTVRALRQEEVVSLRQRVDDLRPHLRPDRLQSFTDDYVAIFSHAARGSCPLNEIEYGDLKADPLFQPHRLADLAAFYRAFGLELTRDAPERHDHLSIELEFMSVLAAKEAFALEHQLDDEQLALCRSAQKEFLREHLGRWAPAFARRLMKAVGEGTLGMLARFTHAYIENDCGRFGVRAGSEDLMLRPVDPSGESLCSSCGITSLLPGQAPRCGD